MSYPAPKRRRRTTGTATTVGTALGVGVIFIVLFILLFAISTAFTALLVALVWNWLGLHSVFGAGELTFWQVVGVAIGINILRSIFAPETNGVRVNS